MSVKVDFRPGRIIALPLSHESASGTTRSYDGQPIRNEKQKIIAAATELETMKLRETTPSLSSSSPSEHRHHHQRFPPACLRILRNLPGNARCIDCEERQPEWASISHGTLLCISCAGRHRALGVNTSKVRSVSMDSWSHADVVAMLEGGNYQLASFYTRHHLCKESYGHYRSGTLLSQSASFSSSSSTTSTSSSTCSGSCEDGDGGYAYDDDIMINRYRTRAGLFYRKNLRLHVQKVCSLGVYKGREAYRGSEQG